MKGFVGNIERLTIENKAFRRVLFTAKHQQLVVMRIPPGEEVGMEVHATIDQFFRVEQGEAKIIMDGKEHRIPDGGTAIVPAGTTHNVINPSRGKDLLLYTVYSPPEHPPGTVHATKKEADKAEEDEKKKKEKVAPRN